MGYPVDDATGISAWVESSRQFRLEADRNEARAEAAEQRYDRLVAGVRELGEESRRRRTCRDAVYITDLEALLADDGEAGR